MAYTIISQNNTTTTLADENGNVITVPARVTLATSTDYTITKVNNNSVDLVDGNGKVIRGVPACVVLAGDGGGSGGVTSVNGQTGAVVLSIPDAVQYSTMPTASANNLGDIIQFTGTTDANYTNGYFYKCVSDGQEPATYSWTAVQVQASSGGGLPSQTGQSGKFLTTDGTDASWSDKPLVNTATDSNSIVVSGNNNANTAYDSVTFGKNAKDMGASVVVGYNAQCSSYNSVIIGKDANTAGSGCVCIGKGATSTVASAGQIVIGWNNTTNNTNSDANTFKIGNMNGNFMIMNANGNLPADRLASTTGLADGNYRLRLVMASGVPTLSWVAE